VLVDTSALIAGERRGGLRASEMPAHAEAALSVITVMEVRRGIERARDASRRRRRAELLETALAASTVLDVTVDVAIAAASAWSRLEERGTRIPALDLLIAATALAHGLPLLSADAHFAHVDGLELIALGPA
jgi:predicted nucleic acid-binding protein